MSNTPKILFWIGIIWVALDLIWAVVFLAGNPHYFTPGSKNEMFLFGNIIGFFILSITGVVLILVGKHKLNKKIIKERT